jgi:hypothetical protein
MQPCKNQVKQLKNALQNVHLSCIKTVRNPAAIPKNLITKWNFTADSVIKMDNRKTYIYYVGEQREIKSCKFKN